MAFSILLYADRSKQIFHLLDALFFLFSILFFFVFDYSVF